jgi:ribosomal protein S18 acetylase RimI-like enzyme
MIELISHRDPVMARTIHRLQQISYAVESDLIDYPDPEFPPLQETAEDIQKEGEHFLGFWQNGKLVGVLSFAVGPQGVEIGRMIVHPGYFRRGIASRLLHAVEAWVSPGQTLIVSTAEKNTPAVKLYEKYGYQLRRRTTLPNGIVLVQLAKVIRGAR